MNSQSNLTFFFFFLVNRYCIDHKKKKKPHRGYTKGEPQTPLQDKENKEIEELQFVLTSKESSMSKCLNKSAILSTTKLKTLNSHCKTYLFSINYQQQLRKLCRVCHSHNPAWDFSTSTTSLASKTHTVNLLNLKNNNSEAHQRPKQ